MNLIIKLLTSRKFTKAEWLFIKIPLSYFFARYIIKILLSDNFPSVPTGLCLFIDCSLLNAYPLNVILIFSSVFLALIYIMEVKMRWVTLGMFILCVLVFTLEESTGILNRNGMFSFVFFAQSIAYWYHRLSPNFISLWRNRIHFSIQVVVVGYTLSALTKLYHSGVSWPIDGKLISLQIIKSFYYQWVTNLDESALIKANIIIDFLEKNSLAIVIVLSISLMLELFSFSALLFGRFGARVYGFLLLSMHIGIDYFMNIYITSIVSTMIIIMINPFYIVYQLLDFIRYRWNSNYKIKFY